MHYSQSEESKTEQTEPKPQATKHKLEEADDCDSDVPFKMKKLPTYISLSDYSGPSVSMDKPGESRGGNDGKQQQTTDPGREQKAGTGSKFSLCDEQSFMLLCIVFLVLSIWWYVCESFGNVYLKYGHLFKFQDRYFVSTHN